MIPGPFLKRRYRDKTGGEKDGDKSERERVRRQRGVVRERARAQTSERKNGEIFFTEEDSE